MNGFSFSQSVNWPVVYKILTALAVAPLGGFIIAYIFMKLSRVLIKHPKYFRGSPPVGPRGKKE